jgi:hypothetical protein
MNEVEPIKIMVPPWLAAHLESEGGALPDYCEVVDKLPATPQGALLIACELGRWGDVQVFKPLEVGGPAEAMRGPAPQPMPMPYWLAIAIEASIREHNPFPIAPTNPSWPAAAALLLCRQILERAGRARVSPRCS